MAPRIVKVMLVVAVIGAAAQATRVVFFTPARESSELEAHLSEVEALARPPLATADPAILRGWFEAQTGIPFPALPEAASFRLIGGRIEHGEGRARAVVVYTNGGDRVLLHVQPGAETSHTAQTTDVGGLTTVTWAERGFDYALKSSVPASALIGFVPPGTNLNAPPG
jgi:anti-sigma factor RsiW